MHQLLFKNRFNALIFVVVILVGVRLLVGTGDESGALESATERFGSNGETTNVAPQEVIRAAPRPVATEFTPDEELIDDTSGQPDSALSIEADVGEGPGQETFEITDESVEG